MFKLNRTVASILAISVVALSGSAFAGPATTFTNDSNIGNGSSAHAYTFNHAKNFYGTFDYNSKKYGVVADGATEPTFNIGDGGIDSLAANTDVYVIGEYTNTAPNNSVFRIYKQKYSVVLANNAIQAVAASTSAAPVDREFVRDIVGRGTTSTEFAALGNTTLKYKGKVFNHITTGDFSYDIDTVSKTGSGKFSNLKGKLKDVDIGDFIMEGDLQSAPLAVVGGVMRVVDGDIDLRPKKLDGTDHAFFRNKLNIDYPNQAYDLGVYGPNADEVAGHIHHLANPGEQHILGGIGFAGKKQP